jgi:hypothetical protein
VRLFGLPATVDALSSIEQPDLLADERGFDDLAQSRRLRWNVAVPTVRSDLSSQDSSEAGDAEGACDTALTLASVRPTASWL